MTFMLSGSRRLALAFAVAAAAGTTACDGGGESKTSDDIAADSALAADLALANRDTLLVDSIGAYRPPGSEDESTASDTSLVDADLNMPAPETPAATRPSPPASTLPRNTQPAPPAAPRAEPAPPRSSTPSRPRTASGTTPERPRAAPPVATLPEPTPPEPTPPVASRRTGSAACNSPTPADQQTCVRTTLASTDMRLNRIYRALITEMRRREGSGNGGKEPPSVQRLRVAQRSWLVYRDTECRRRGRGREGRLWAPPRVQCLGEFSRRRANELADQFSRLTASD